MWEFMIQFMYDASRWLILLIGIGIGIGVSFLFVLWRLAVNWA